MTAAPASALARDVPGPSRLAHCGRVEAAGAYVDAALLGEETARRRVLAAWVPGARVYTAARGYVLRWPEPRPLRVEGSPGVPLVAVDGRLLAAPLSEAERERTAAPRGSVVLVVAGAYRVAALGPEVEVDPASWLDLGRVTVLSPFSLGSPALPPAAAAGAGLEPTRTALEDVPAASVEAEQFLATLGATAAGGTAGRAARRASSGVLLAGDGDVTSPVVRLVHFGPVRRWLRRRLGLERERPTLPAAGPVPRPGRGGERIPLGRPGRLRRWLRRWLSPPDGANTTLRQVRRGARSDLRALGPPRRPPWWRRWIGRGAHRTAEESLSRSPAPPAPPPRGGGLTARLREWLLRSPLGGLIASWQEQYLARLLQLFREGQLDEALRHAVPLGLLRSDLEPVRAVGTPRRREDLSFGAPRRPRRPQVYPITPALGGHLEGLYRDACRRLERAGRIETAAFVLFELLGADEEGIALLERHGRFEKAARIAEARELDPALTVRLYLLANDVEAALRVALNATGVLGEVIARLEKGSSADQLLADRLRERYARRLAEAGDLLAAVELVWRHRERHDALPLATWAARGAALGGVAGARLLAFWASLPPEDEDAVWRRADALLAAREPEGETARWALARALLQLPAAPLPSSLARVTLRALLGEVDGCTTLERWRALRALATQSGDRALVADLPQLEIAGAPERPTGVRLVLAASEAGRRELHDAALLPDGRLLVALGEAGVAMLNRDGREVHRFAEPAHALVLSDLGNRALAVAHRGREQRLARLDLETRQGAYWGQLPLHGMADTWDGAQWLCVSGDDLLLLDTLADAPTRVWRAPDVGIVLGLARSPATFAVHTLVTTSGVEFPRQAEVWRFDARGPTLRERTPFEEASVSPGQRAWQVVGALAPWGAFVTGVYTQGEAVPPNAAPEAAELRGPTRHQARPFPTGWQPGAGVIGTSTAVQSFTPRDPDAEPDYAVWAFPAHGPGHYLDVVAEPRAERAQVRALRLVDELLLVADSAGRVLVYDLELGQVRARFAM